LLVCKALDLKKKHIVWDQGVYEGDLDGLLAVLARVPPEALTVLLVGHNPGLEELVRFLTDNDLDEPGDGKLMPTAALARLEMPDDWTQLEPGCATVMGIVRPKQLK
jgi:phosphohistidine phosphatase